MSRQLQVLNDIFRQNLLDEQHGLVKFSSAVRSLPNKQPLFDAISQVEFSNAEAACDHSFGRVEVPGIDPIVWLIEYWNPDLEHPALNPLNPIPVIL